MTTAPFPPKKPGFLAPLAVLIGAIPWLPRLLKQIVWVDRGIQKITRGRLTLVDIAGLPNLVLTTVGRKSGIARSTPLLCVPDNHRILIVGSMFGGPIEPMWVKNIEANPEVTIRFRGVQRQMTARHLTGLERSEAWVTLTGIWPNFDLYEQRTHREIKVFELTPTP